MKASALKVGTEMLPQRGLPQKWLWSFSRPSKCSLHLHMSYPCFLEISAVSAPDKAGIFSFTKYIIPLCTVNNISYILVNRLGCCCFSWTRLSIHQPHFLGQTLLTTPLFPLVFVDVTKKQQDIKSISATNIVLQMHTQHWTCLFWVAYWFIIFFFLNALCRADNFIKSSWESESCTL